MYGTGAYILHQIPGIFKPADRTGAELLSSQGKGSFLPAFKSSHIGKGVRRRIHSFHAIISSPERRFHNAAGHTENHACSGTLSQRGVKRFFREQRRSDMFCPDKSCEFTGGQNNIHIGSRSRAVHIRQYGLHLFGNTGHDGNTADLLRIHSRLLRKIALGNCPEHLLGGFGSGKMIRHFRILGFHEPYPGRTAGGEHGPSFFFRIRQPGQQFIAFFHYSEIGGEIGIKHIIKTYFFQRGYHPAFRRHIGRHIQGLSPGGSHCRRHLHYRNGFRISQRAENL